MGRTSVGLILVPHPSRRWLCSVNLASQLQGSTIKGVEKALRARTFGRVPTSKPNVSGGSKLEQTNFENKFGGEMASRECPNCHSKRNWKDGKRQTNIGSTQRFICRDCGLRFSNNSYKDNLRSDCSQISAEKAKNLVFTAKTENAVEDADQQGLLTQFRAYLERKAYNTDNRYPDLLTHLVNLGANLRTPETVETVIAQLTHVNRKGETVKDKNGTKMIYCAAYAAFCKMLKIEWENPGYKQEEIEVYVPYENELDACITGAQSARMAAYLQTLKETFADPGEALKIRWIDIDEKNITIKINFPVKGHRSGTQQVTSRLLSMLAALPHDNERVFPSNYEVFAEMFRVLKRRLARVQQNPRFLNLELRGFRHWGGTKVAYETNGNVLEVQKQLRHKNISSSMKYIGRINFSPRECDTTSATTLEDILRLRSEGWKEYTVVKINGVEHHCFEKPKAFRNN